jgi:hypothetical protein
MARRRRRNPPVALLALAGAAVAAYFFFGKKSSTGLKAGVVPVRNPDGTFVVTGSSRPGVPAGTTTALKFRDGSVLDPRGIPIGAKLSDGSTWGGVTVVDTSDPNRPAFDPADM